MEASHGPDSATALPPGIRARAKRYILQRSFVVIRYSTFGGGSNFHASNQVRDPDDNNPTVLTVDQFDSDIAVVVDTQIAIEGGCPFLLSTARAIL